MSTFRDEALGHALWLEALRPYWTPYNGKVLCRSEDAAGSSAMTSMFSTDTLHDISIRIVEVFATPISAFGYGVVVEVVNKRNWVHIVRFVVTDIATLKIFLYKEAHTRTHRQESLEPHETFMNSERPKRRGSSSKLPAHTIRIYDETVRHVSLQIP